MPILLPSRSDCYLIARLLSKVPTKDEVCLLETHARYLGASLHRLMPLYTNEGLLRSKKTTLLATLYWKKLQCPWRDKHVKLGRHSSAGTAAWSAVPRMPCQYTSVGRSPLPPNVALYWPLRWSSVDHVPSYTGAAQHYSGAHVAVTTNRVDIRGAANMHRLFSCLNRGDRTINTDATHPTVAAEHAPIVLTTLRSI